MIAVQSALFALDAYNRATAPSDFGVPYGAEVLLTRVVGNFAAAAYFLADSDEVVIAYRGTDNPLGDGITGWPIGSGQYDWVQSQADQAFAFFNDVKSLAADPTHTAHSASWSLAGHSLGGGLAGLVASINHLPAYVFDSMPFTEAAEKLYGDVSGPYASNYTYWSALAFPDGVVHSPSFSQIQSTAIADEVLSGLRWGGPVADYPFAPTSGQDAQLIYQNEIVAGTVTNPVDLHSQALLTIALHGGLAPSGARGLGGDAIYKLLFDQDLALDLGFEDPEALRQHLAYTIDDDVVALDGLFSDMDVLGQMSISDSMFTDVLARLSVAHAVRVGHDGQLTVGVLDLAAGIVNVALDGVEDQTSTILPFWELIQGTPLDVSGFGLSNLTIGASGYGGTAQLLTGGTVFFGSDYADEVLGSNSLDVIFTAASDDTIVGGAGNDTISGGIGSDAMLGDVGNDIIHIGEADEGDVDFIDGGTASDTVVADKNAVFDFTPSVVEALLPLVPSGPFSTPTGPAFVAQTGAGRAYVQRVEKIVSVTDGNEIIADDVQDMIVSGVSTVDFSATADDSVTLNDDTSRWTYLSLTAVQGISHGTLTHAFAGSASVSVVGVESWIINGALASTGAISSRITLDRAALDGPEVEINALGAMDRLVLSALSSVGQGVTVTLVENGEALALGAVSLRGAEGITGGVGADTLTGNSGVNYISGGVGRDVIAGLGGADVIDDSDWVVLDYSASASTITIKRSSTGYVGSGGDAEGDKISVSGRLDVVGSEHNDKIEGGYEIWGGGGNDTLTGILVHAGEDYDTVFVNGNLTSYVDFGSGGGELHLAKNSQKYFVDIEAGIYQQISSTAAGQLPAIFHTLTVIGDYDKIVGSNYADEIHGSSHGDIILGGGGSDTIYGGGGDDRIEGFGLMFGGDGKDTILVTSAGIAYGDAGDDTITTSQRWVSMLGGIGNDTLTTTSSGSQLNGGGGGDVITGPNEGTQWNYANYEWAPGAVGVTYNGASGAGTGIGWAGEAAGDTLTGNFGFHGSSHADTFNVTLRGGYGVELRAGSGDDILNVNLGASTFVYGNGIWHHTDGSDDDSITNSSALGTIYGGAGNDTIMGGGTIFGDAGADTITSNAGNHNIYMGVDNDIDTFVFSRTTGFDRLYEFDIEDVIRIGSGYKYDDFGDILQNSQQNGANIDVSFESDTKITIINYQLTNLTADNFLFT